MKANLAALIRLLEQANDLGHNAESEHDRELFARYLLDNGVSISPSAYKTVEQVLGHEPPDNVNELFKDTASEPKMQQPCELWGECEYYDEGYCILYARPIDDITDECQYWEDPDDSDMGV